MVMSIRERKWGQSVIVSGVQTASTNGVGDNGYAGVQNIILQLAVTAFSGTTPSMVVNVQDSIDGTNWNNIATFTAATGVTAQVIRVPGPIGNTIRAISTITGTTPSFTFSVVVQAEGR